MFLDIGPRSVQDSERRKANQVNSSDVTTCPQFWTMAQGEGFPAFLLELRSRDQGSGSPRRGMGWNEPHRRTAFWELPSRLESLVENCTVHAKDQLSKVKERTTIGICKSHNFQSSHSSHQSSGETLLHKQSMQKTTHKGHALVIDKTSPTIKASLNLSLQKNVENKTQKDQSDSKLI